MNWFRKPYSVCQQCKVHFEPAPKERHAELCPEHRKPVVELEDRILLVMDWAKAHWEELEPRAIEERNKQRGISQQSLQAMYNQHMQQQSRSGLSDMASIFGL